MSIGAGAFANSGMTSIFIPPSVVFIGEDALPTGVMIYAMSGSYASSLAGYTVILIDE